MIQAYKKKKLLQGFSSDICRLPKPVASQQAAWGVNEKMEREREKHILFGVLLFAYCICRECRENLNICIFRKSFWIKTACEVAFQLVSVWMFENQDNLKLG